MTCTVQCCALAVRVPFLFSSRVATTLCAARARPTVALRLVATLTIPTTSGNAVGIYFCQYSPYHCQLLPQRNETPWNHLRQHSPQHLRVLMHDWIVVAHLQRSQERMQAASHDAAVLLSPRRLGVQLRCKRAALRD